VTVIDQILFACLYEIRNDLEIYIPILATNALLLIFLEQVTLRKGPIHALGISLKHSFPFFVLIIVVGFVREYMSVGLPLLNYAAGTYILFGLLIAGSKRLELDVE